MVPAAVSEFGPDHHAQLCSAALTTLQDLLLPAAGRVPGQKVRNRADAPLTRVHSGEPNTVMTLYFNNCALSMKGSLTLVWFMKMLLQLLWFNRAASFLDFVFYDNILIL